MSEHASDRAAALMAGPRGRALLMEFAGESARAVADEWGWHPFTSAVVDASYHLDPEKGTPALSLFGPGAKQTDDTVVAPEEVARQLAGLDLIDVTAMLLRDLVTHSVEEAAYWQKPRGSDVLAATWPVRAALSRVADHIAATELTSWWFSDLDSTGQQCVWWCDDTAPIVTGSIRDLLRAHREDRIEWEARARRSRPADPTAAWSGEWWSPPPSSIWRTTRTLYDASPAGLWWVEDSMGESNAWTRSVEIENPVRVAEIANAEAWAELCLRFPLSVSAQVRHDWYRTTGRVGAWVIPDWAAVSEHYDAVHLQVGAYLSAAGRAIPVDDDTASVIAGWNPDETYWLGSSPEPTGARVAWTRNSGEAWRRA